LRYQDTHYRRNTRKKKKKKGKEGEGVGEVGAAYSDLPDKKREEEGERHSCTKKFTGEGRGGGGVKK